MEDEDVAKEEGIIDHGSVDDGDVSGSGMEADCAAKGLEGESYRAAATTPPTTMHTVSSNESRQEKCGMKLSNEARVLLALPFLL